MNGFRNYGQLHLELTDSRLLIIGPNGIGKSNILEAAELLGSLKSHRSSNDIDFINWGEDKALLTGVTNDNEVLELAFRRKGGRQVWRNNKTLKRHIDLIGPLRCVCFSSTDLSLTRGVPLLRRNWLDRVVQQLEPIYANLISTYSKLIKQRNQLWKYLQNHTVKEKNALLDAFDEQMALASTRIHRRRKRALMRLEPLAAIWQDRLSNGKEKLALKYCPGSELDEMESEEIWRLSIQKQLTAQRLEEERIGFCKVGPHRDEIELLVNGMSAKKFASSGQQRTIVLALKLAELELVEEIHSEPPLLLLDDVLAELDKSRQLLLLEAVGQSHQCMITATHLEAFEGAWQRQSQVLDVAKLSYG